MSSPTPRQKKKMRREWMVWTLGPLGVIFLCAFVTATFFIVRGNQIAYEQEQMAVPPEEPDLSKVFPVSVDAYKKEIVQNPVVEEYFDEHISAVSDPTTKHVSVFGKVLGKLALMNWYQNLASVSSRILVIQSGERKEQVADNFGKILKWNNAQKKEFLSYIEETTPALADGKLYPGTYTVAKEATPKDVATLVTDRFATEVLSKYTSEVEAKVPLDDTLIIASLIEREAYDFTDMRLISGVIWNRLFTDMRLQIDATLQYAKGSKPSQPWWPQVVPADKNIASVYNTYKNNGLPPAPIANPSLESILAALNPVKTDCMYYFHDQDSQFHCNVTYEEHVAELKEYYGRGK